MIRLVWEAPEGTEITAGTKVRIMHFGREETGNVERVYGDGNYRIKLSTLFDRVNVTQDQIIQVEKLIRS